MAQEYLCVWTVNVFPTDLANLDLYNISSSSIEIIHYLLTIFGLPKARDVLSTEGGYTNRA